MKAIISFLFLLLPLTLFSQRFYRTSGGELIFSRTLNNEPINGTSINMRVSSFFHINQYYHYDFGKSLGVFAGYSVSNIGFIYQMGDTTYKKRAYTFGVPIGLKIGNVSSGKYLFVGGEIESPFHYKQKKIYDNQKDKYSSFFNKRTNAILPSIFAGIQLYGGVCFKFRILLSDFLNKDFKGTDFGIKTDYKLYNSKLFLISVSYNLKEIKLKRMVKKQNERYAYLEI
jgi:hypothetical protein